jgi:hypothetical protein
LLLFFKKEDFSFLTSGRRTRAGRNPRQASSYLLAGGVASVFFAVVLWCEEWCVLWCFVVVVVFFGAMVSLDGAVAAGAGAGAGVAAGAAGAGAAGAGVCARTGEAANRVAASAAVIRGSFIGSP